MFVVDPQPILLILGAVLLVTHPRERGAEADLTLHITAAGVADHTCHTAAVGGPTLVLAPLTVDHQLAGAGHTPQIITTGGAGTVLDRTPQKRVTTAGGFGTILGLTAQKTATTGGAGTIVGLTAQKSVMTGGAGTTRGIIHQTTEHQ